MEGFWAVFPSERNLSTSHFLSTLLHRNYRCHVNVKAFYGRFGLFDEGDRLSLWHRWHWFGLCNGLSGRTLCASLGVLTHASDLCFHYVSRNNILCVAVLIPSNNLAVNACHCCALGQLWHGNSSRLHVIYATCACRKGGNRLHSANRYHTSHGDSHLHYLRNHRQ